MGHMGTTGLDGGERGCEQPQLSHTSGHTYAPPWKGVQTHRRASGASSPPGYLKTMRCLPRGAVKLKTSQADNA